MKQIIFSIGIITLLYGCDNVYNDKIYNEENNASLVTFTFNGERHQFVKYDGASHRNTYGIAHWPGCVYCNKQNSEDNPD